MKSDKRILLAFILNAVFSVIEFIGGAVTGSVAIVSDAVHDLGDSVSIGLSYILEKISKRHPDKTYTYGYLRYSVFGSLITTLILICGSVLVIVNAVLRLINPVAINYNGMIILAVFGATVNFAASYFTSGAHSLNEKAVSLHLFEDVLGWIVVLLGAVIMRFTDISYIDPIMSIAVAVFILFHAFKNLRAVLDIFLDKAPTGIDTDDIKEHLLGIDGVSGVHNLHIRSLDGVNNIASVHIVTDHDFAEVKHTVKHEFAHHGICYCTVETERTSEECTPENEIPIMSAVAHHHHH